MEGALAPGTRPRSGVAVNSYSLTHLSDQTLLRDLVAYLAHERTATAIVLAHIAEVDARRLYGGRFEGCGKG